MPGGGSTINRLNSIYQYAGKSILDVGCVSGVYMRHLLPRGYDIFGIDVMPIEKWDEYVRSLTTVGNATALPYADKSFYTVDCLRIVKYLKNKSGTETKGDVPNVQHGLVYILMGTSNNSQSVTPAQSEVQ